ncbi:inositol 1,4,5-trisphosphate/ryanodine receptor-domain-containing protein [Baffinella frigidus]|nr:inositol 1,4,5-trisphosphate/ryanodine receptor-domain-containing protein [Cryptophyta sp. CCMP2293]
MSLPALLSFYDPDVPWPPLRYGDTVAIIPDGVNGLMAYSGSTDARPWVEILQEGATLPPNVRDCHFRIISRHQYVESKMLQKMQKSGQWDGGRSLPLPATPEHGEDLKTIAALLCQEHSLPDEYLVQELLTRLKNTAEEKEGNESETKRQQGQVVRFGDAIELQHVTTGKIISLSKQQAYERAAKKLDMVVEGSEASTLSIRPAVKAYATGELVGSGDLVVLNLIKKIAGFSYSVHLGAAENEKWQATIVKATLKVTNQIVIGAFEVNATAGERPSAFRLVQFEPFHFNPMNVKRFKDISSRFRSEEIVCFYHKEAEAYLTYRRQCSGRRTGPQSSPGRKPLGCGKSRPRSYTTQARTSCARIPPSTGSSTSCPTDTLSKTETNLRSRTTISHQARSSPSGRSRKPLLRSLCTTWASSTSAPRPGGQSSSILKRTRCLPRPEPTAQSRWASIRTKRHSPNSPPPRRSPRGTRC